MNTSGGGGSCDCGDAEAWKEGHACDIHRPRSEAQAEDVSANILYNIMA